MSQQLRRRWMAALVATTLVSVVPMLTAVAQWEEGAKLWQYHSSGSGIRWATRCDTEQDHCC
jgi:hypothetical protein